MKKERKELTALLLTALTTTVSLLMIYAVLDFFPFGDNSVLTGDLNGQYIPYFAHYREVLRGSAGPTVTFEKALGGSLPGIFAYYCSSLFNFIYMVIPVEWYAQAAGVVLLIKLVLAAVFFSYFVHRHYPLLPMWAQIALANGYGLCAYNLVYAQNIMWHDVMLLLPLLCCGLDVLVRKGKPRQYALTLLLIIFSNFYIGYMVCIFAVLYFIWLLITERPPKMKRALLQFTVASLAGGLTNGWLLVPTLADLNQNKGELLSFSFLFEQNFSLPQLFQRLFPWTFQWTDVEAGLPNIYCGILALVLVCVFFASRAIPLREKLAGGGILIVLVVSFWVTGLDTIWHALKTPVWFPYRYSFLFSFWLLFLSAGAAARVTFDRRILAAAATMLGSGFLLAVAFRSPGVSGRALVVGLVVAFVLVVLLCLLGKSKRVAVVLVLFCMIELGVNSWSILGQFELYTVSEYQQFVLSGRQTVSEIQRLDDDYYRIEKTENRTLNDPMLLGYWGISHFGSTQDDASVELLMRLGYGNYAGCNTYFYGSTPVSDALLGIRYVMQPEGGRQIPSGYEKIQLDTDWAVYQNPYALPLVLTAPKELEELLLENGEDLFLWQQRILTLLARKEDAPVYIAAQMNSLNDTTLEITVQKDGLCYAFMLTETESDVYVDGRIVGTVRSNDRRGTICLGDFKAGQTVKLELEQPLQVGYCYTLDDAALKELCEQIRADAPQIQQMEDGRVVLTVTAEENEFLWLSTGYNKQWSATVNNKTARTTALAQAFQGVELQPGENEVVLVWKASGVWPGLFVTIIGLVLLAGLTIWQVQQTNKLKKRM